MRWRGERESENVEDRRGEGGGFRFPFPGGGVRFPSGGGSGGRGGGIGIVGLLIILGLMLFFGVDPSVIMQGGGPGGDATTFESVLAHRTVLNSMNPASPVNRRNLPTTCGRCHAGPFVAFQKSQHFALLEKGDTRVPVCSTCHGAAGFRRPSARALEVQCAQCHGPNRIAPRAERAEAARTLYDALHESRDMMKTVRSLVNRVSDKTRRAALDEAYQQTEVPLIQAVQAGHEFVYDELRDRLSVARQRMEALLGQLANPKP